jgi:hypothetical protein
MKKYYQKPELVLALEKDDTRNNTGMQLRIWKLDRGVTLLVRMLKHNADAHKKLWDGKRTNGEVNEIILNLLKRQKIINDRKSWVFSVDTSNILKDQDEHEEKDHCYYFAWSVSEWKLIF